MSDTFQTLTLVMRDGRRVRYMGLPQLEPGTEVFVVGILVSEPQPLPPGCSWDVLGGDGKGVTE